MNNEITRRTFLTCLAAIPLVAALPENMQGAESVNVRAIAEEAASGIKGRNIVILIPDSTRSGGRFIGEALRGFYRAKARHLDSLKVIVALGTHPALSEDAILRYLNITPDEYRKDLNRMTFLNHEWWKPETFVQVGQVSAGKWKELSNDYMDLADFRRREGIPVRFNRTAAEADDLVIMGPVVPHEVVGCSGGLKYCSPGIGDTELTGYTHWLGAVLTIPGVIGVIDTPVRRIINHCVNLMKKPRKHLIAFVPDGEVLLGVYAGSPEEAFEKAARHTLRVNVEYTGRRYKRALAILSPRYDDMWTGGKGSYKLIQIVEMGGQLVIYAPHLKEVSKTWGRDIERLGYHCLDYVRAHLSEYLDRGINPCVLAHLTHVYGPGTYEGGVESPSVVHLATGLDASTCSALNFSYIDPSSIDIDAWRRDPDTYVGDDAGQRLVLPTEPPG